MTSNFCTYAWFTSLTHFSCFFQSHGTNWSKLQALEQCDATLNELGVHKVSTDDTAAAAQVLLSSIFILLHQFVQILTPQQIVASERVTETAAIASSRAAQIYGLEVLAERIQVRFFLIVSGDHDSWNRISHKVHSMHSILSDFMNSLFIYRLFNLFLTVEVAVNFCFCLFKLRWTSTQTNDFVT